MIDLLQPENGEMPQPMQDVGQLYEQERALLDKKEILPLVNLPDYVALSPAVRDWLPTLWGEWNLADVWLDRGEKTPANSPDAAVPKAFCGAHP
jgi:hypothetical protein